MTDPGVKTTVFEHTDDKGKTYVIERLERVMDVGEIPSDKINIGCEACDKYGKNLACPPYSPYIKDYIEDRKTARVICLRVPLEQFDSVIPDERYWEAYRMTKALLEEDLLQLRKKGQLIAGSGPCRRCDECAIETGKEFCRYPNRRIYSLEAMGVSVVLLTERAFDMPLEWSGTENSADFVSAIGAVFE